MKIYTKTGDKGTTALFGGKRVPKHHIRIDSYGTVDELNSHIGLIRDQNIDANSKGILINIIYVLFQKRVSFKTVAANSTRCRIIELTFFNIIQWGTVFIKMPIYR